MDEGSVTTILGANGAGKTTTSVDLRMVRTEGSVVMAGEEICGKATEDIVRTGIARARRARHLHAGDDRGELLPAPIPAAKIAGCKTILTGFIPISRA